MSAPPAPVDCIFKKLLTDQVDSWSVFIPLTMHSYRAVLERVKILVQFYSWKFRWSDRLILRIGESAIVLIEENLE